MIQTQLKLKLTRAQESRLDQWLPVFAAIWNWGVRKIELNARDGMMGARNVEGYYTGDRFFDGTKKDYAR